MKIRTSLAAAALVAGSAAVPVGAALVTAAPAGACTVSYHGVAHLNPKPAYAEAVITADSCGVQYHVKALCKSTPTSGVTVYGPTHSSPGTSKVDCPGSDNLSAAWAVIGGVSHQFYP